MLDECRYLYDAASLAAIGRRDLQEDAVAMHFPDGAALGYIVLADGMGGHAAGDIASKMVVQEFFDELQVHLQDPDYLERHVGAILRDALDRANGRVHRHAAKWPNRRGMGATLVAPLIIGNRLYWISVGDSPLYLLRGDRLSRLNQEHSMAQRLDTLAQRGVISSTQAEQDPDRFCLTSVLLGEAVSEIDCRDRPLDLADGDILIVASDGLLFIDEARIAGLVYEYRDRPSAEISERLLREIREFDDPDQDNVSLCVVKIGTPEAEVLQCESAASPLKPRVVPRRLTVQMQVRRSADRQSQYYSSASEG
jgi:PPM family protein phosphatase